MTGGFEAAGETPPERSVPEDVGTAYQLWWAVVGLSLAQVLVAIGGVLLDRDAYVDQLAHDLSARDPNLAATRPTIELVLYGGIAVGVALGVGLAALTLLLATQMRRGKAWARTVLTMAGTFLVLLAVPSLFGIGDAVGVASIVSGGLAILAAVAAAGAIVLMHRRASNEFFVTRPPIR